MSVLGAWNFDNVSEGATVYDDVGSHNGTVVGTVPLNSGPISKNSRALPNAASGYIEIPSHSDFNDLTVDKSWELWARPGVVDAAQHQAIVKYDGSTYPVLIGLSSSNYWWAGSYDGTENTLTSDTDVAVVGVLYYVVMVWDVSESTNILYVNGVRKSSNQNLAFTPASAGNSHVLNFNRDTSVHFGGDLCAVRLQDVALTAKNVYDTYHGSNIVEEN